MEAEIFLIFNVSIFRKKCMFNANKIKQDKNIKLINSK